MLVTEEMSALDPHRLMIAAHELGHAIAWRGVDMEVVRIQVCGRGGSADGTVEIVPRPYTSQAQAYGYLVGIFAGMAAGGRWIDEVGQLSRAEHAKGCAADERAYRRNKRALDQPPTRATLLADARALVRREWRTIVRLAPRLAARGTIKL